MDLEECFRFFFKPIVLKPLQKYSIFEFLDQFRSQAKAFWGIILGQLRIFPWKFLTFKVWILNFYYLIFKFILHLLVSMRKLSSNYCKNSKFRLNSPDIWRNNFKNIFIPQIDFAWALIFPKFIWILKYDFRNRNSK